MRAWCRRRTRYLPRIPAQRLHVAVLPRRLPRATTLYCLTACGSCLPVRLTASLTRRMPYAIRNAVPYVRFFGRATPCRYAITSLVTRTSCPYLHVIVRAALLAGHRLILPACCLLDPCHNTHYRLLPLPLDAPLYRLTPAAQRARLLDCTCDLPAAITDNNPYTGLPYNWYLPAGYTVRPLYGSAALELARLPVVRLRLACLLTTIPFALLLYSVRLQFCARTTHATFTPTTHTPHTPTPRYAFTHTFPHTPHTHTHTHYTLVLGTVHTPVPVPHLQRLAACTPFVAVITLHTCLHTHCLAACRLLVLPACPTVYALPCHVHYTFACTPTHLPTLCLPTWLHTHTPYHTFALYPCTAHTCLHLLPLLTPHIRRACCALPALHAYRPRLPHACTAACSAAHLYCHAPTCLPSTPTTCLPHPATTHTLHHTADAAPRACAAYRLTPYRAACRVPACLPCAALLWFRCRFCCTARAYTCRATIPCTRCLMCACFARFLPAAARTARCRIVPCIPAAPDAVGRWLPSCRTHATLPPGLYASLRAHTHTHAHHTHTHCHTTHTHCTHTTHTATATHTHTYTPHTCHV